MIDSGTRQGTVHFDIVHAGNSKDGVNTIGFQQTHKRFADRGLAHVANLSGAMSARFRPMSMTACGMGSPLAMSAAVADNPGADWMP